MDHIPPHATKPSRRTILAAGLAAAASPALPALGGWGAALAQGETETHGLSLFGDLALPADFKHYRYVNPNAPKGGTLKIQTKQTSGNQNFDTFNTLHHYVLRGDGAAGMDNIYDTLMSGTGDEPSTVYGLVARAVRISQDKLTYKFLLRPEARFHDGSKLTAKDVAFSLNVLKAKGHPSFRILLQQMASAEAESDDVVTIKLIPERSKEAHLYVVGMPIFSEAWWRNRDFEGAVLDPPLGSGAYKVGRFEQGRFIEFDRVADYWGKDLPVNVGQNNFNRIRYDYFRSREVAFEAFKSGVMNYNQEFTSRIWHTQYDFPAVKDGRVKLDELETGLPATAQGWWMNKRRDQFKDIRIRKAIALVFDFEWTNKNIMYASFRRTQSFFDNSDYKAMGKPSPEELKLLEPFRDKLQPDVFGEVWVPPASDVSGSDRNLLRQADQLLREAGCKREGSALLLPDGKPFRIEFLDFQASLQPHTQPFQANLKRLGVDASSRIVDAAQYESRMKDFDFDMASRAMSPALIPTDSLRIVYGSASGKQPGGRNIGGIDDPVVDALIDTIGKAASLAEVTIAARALDRVLRNGHYWVPMWYLGKEWVAHWDAFSWPSTKPKFGSGAPSLWWWDAEKAKKSGTQE